MLDFLLGFACGVLTALALVVIDGKIKSRKARLAQIRKHVLADLANYQNPNPSISPWVEPPGEDLVRTLRR